MAAKVRPCVVVSVPFTDVDRSIVTLIPHTTAVRQSQFEVSIPVRFLRPGAFDAQGLVSVPAARLMNRIGALTAEQMQSLERAFAPGWACVMQHTDPLAPPQLPKHIIQNPPALVPRDLTPRIEAAA